MQQLLQVYIDIGQAKKLLITIVIYQSTIWQLNLPGEEPENYTHNDREIMENWNEVRQFFNWLYSCK